MVTPSRTLAPKSGRQGLGVLVKGSLVVLWRPPVCAYIKSCIYVNTCQKHVHTSCQSLHIRVDTLNARAHAYLAQATAQPGIAAYLFLCLVSCVLESNHVFCLVFVACCPCNLCRQLDWPCRPSRRQGFMASVPAAQEASRSLGASQSGPHPGSHVQCGRAVMVRRHSVTSRSAVTA